MSCFWCTAVSFMYLACSLLLFANTQALIICFRCMLRVLDSFGTEPEFNHAHYAQSKGHKTPWGKWNLNPQQFNTMFRKCAWERLFVCVCLTFPLYPLDMETYPDRIRVPGVLGGVSDRLGLWIALLFTNRLWHSHNTRSFPSRTALISD